MDNKSGVLNQSWQPCHVGPVEVIKNFFCGNQEEARTMAASDQICVDTLIPLYTLDASVWDLGFRGEILYYPIADYGILPHDVLNDLVSKILDRLSRGKKIGLFCMGGHGRTGYVASIVLGKLGYEDPIGFLRTKYCQQAVESNHQIRQIAEVLEKPELEQAYMEEQSKFVNDLPFYDFKNTLPGWVISTCGGCASLIGGACQMYHVYIDEDEVACDYFLQRED